MAGISLWSTHVRRIRKHEYVAERVCSRGVAVVDGTRQGCGDLVDEVRKEVAAGRLPLEPKGNGDV
jgi:hypothetical protein